MLCLNKVPVHVKQEPIYTEGDHGRDEQDGELVKRRVVLSAMYDVLPVYGSVAFWRAIEAQGGRCFTTRSPGALCENRCQPRR